MAADVVPLWPDYAELSKHGEQATLKDDMGRNELSVAVVLPYWTERWVQVYDHKTATQAHMRFVCPLNGGGTSPFTLRGVYNLQAAMLRDQHPELSRVHRQANTECVRYSVTREGEGCVGALSVERLNRDWLGLTVVDERESNCSATAFFNRMRSPRVYDALVALGHAIRRDNHHFPRKAAGTVISLSAA